MNVCLPNKSSIVLNPEMAVHVLVAGHEKIPVIIIDDFVLDPSILIGLAEPSEGISASYQHQASDFYPGIRKPSPYAYTEQLKQLQPLFQSVFHVNYCKNIDVVMSAFSISTTPASELRPIQTLPHFDTPMHNQWAIVHYLCGEQHGGTSLYRHKKTGFERITQERLTLYRKLIKAQAIAEKLHEHPHYIDGDTQLFERILSVDAKMNRAVIYPSNALHSGNIKPETGLSSSPTQGRLTLSSFIQLK